MIRPVLQIGNDLFRTSKEKSDSDAKNKMQCVRLLQERIAFYSIFMYMVTNNLPMYLWKYVSLNKFICDNYQIFHMTQLEYHVNFKFKEKERAELKLLLRNSNNWVTFVLACKSN